MEDKTGFVSEQERLSSAPDRGLQEFCAEILQIVIENSGIELANPLEILYEPIVSLKDTKRFLRDADSSFRQEKRQVKKFFTNHSVSRKKASELSNFIVELAARRAAQLAKRYKRGKECNLMDIYKEDTSAGRLSAITGMAPENVKQLASLSNHKKAMSRYFQLTGIGVSVSGVAVADYALVAELDRMSDEQYAKFLAAHNTYRGMPISYTAKLASEALNYFTQNSGLPVWESDYLNTLYQYQIIAVPLNSKRRHFKECKVNPYFLSKGKYEFFLEIVSRAVKYTRDELKKARLEDPEAWFENIAKYIHSPYLPLSVRLLRKMEAEGKTEEMQALLKVLLVSRFSTHEPQKNWPAFYSLPTEEVAFWDNMELTYNSSEYGLIEESGILISVSNSLSQGDKISVALQKAEKKFLEVSCSEPVDPVYRALHLINLSLWVFKERPLVLNSILSHVLASFELNTVPSQRKDIAPIMQQLLYNFFSPPSQHFRDNDSLLLLNEVLKRLPYASTEPMHNVYSTAEAYGYSNKYFSWIRRAIHRHPSPLNLDLVNAFLVYAQTGDDSKLKALAPKLHPESVPKDLPPLQSINETNIAIFESLRKGLQEMYQPNFDNLIGSISEAAGDAIFSYPGAQATVDLLKDIKEISTTDGNKEDKVVEVASKYGQVMLDLNEFMRLLGYFDRKPSLLMVFNVQRRLEELSPIVFQSAFRMLENKLASARSVPDTLNNCSQVIDSLIGLFKARGYGSQLLDRAKSLLKSNNPHSIAMAISLVQRAGHARFVFLEQSISDMAENIMTKQGKTATEQREQKYKIAQSLYKKTLPFYSADGLSELQKSVLRTSSQTAKLEQQFVRDYLRKKTWPDNQSVYRSPEARAYRLMKAYYGKSFPQVMEEHKKQQVFIESTTSSIPVLIIPGVENPYNFFWPN